MEALVYFAIWAVFAVLMMRLGGRAQMLGRGQEQAQDQRRPVGGAALRWVAPMNDTDPVCGKIVTTEKAKPSVYAGQVYYFCTRECREVFEAAPALYVGAGKSAPRKLEHSHA